MNVGTIEMRFVLGFLFKDSRVLLIKRLKKPYINKWNGTGGKIAKNETPIQAFIRETEEETEIKLNSNQAHYVGIVTWKTQEYTTAQGMFVFTTELTKNQLTWDEEKITREGTLAWHPISWTNDKQNKEVAENIPFFLI